MTDNWDSTERDTLDLAIRWAPYGGADDETIFIALGITRPEFLNKLEAILTRVNELPTETAHTLTPILTAWASTS